MKRVFFIISLFFCHIPAFSQNTVLGRIVYDISYMQDLQNPNNFYKDQMVLQFNKNSSVYRSQLFIETSELERKRTLKLLESSDAGMIIDNGAQLTRGTNVRYYNFYDAKTNYQYWPSGGTYYAIKEPLEKINWKIENEVRGIGGYGCQKATGKCHGRTYVVWFSTDIPYPYGPRKLWGLPGMILEASDTENQIIYKLNRVDLKPMPNEKIELPKNTVVTTRQEYTKMQNAMAKGAGNTTGVYNAPNGATITVTNNNNNNPHSSSSSAIDKNPIDRE